MATNEYYLADSLQALRSEVDGRWPDRNRKSPEGWIGDPSHQARKSDHNPDYVVPPPRRGVVRAIDLNIDGIDVQQVLEAVVGDPRAAYVIHDRKIASATDDGTPWDWEPYDGDSPHETHIHVSIKHTSSAETNTAAWFKAAPPQGDDVTKEQADELLDLNRKILRELQGINAREGYVANQGMKDVDRIADKIAGND